jgi:hypothetical protein
MKRSVLFLITLLLVAFTPVTTAVVGSDWTTLCEEPVGLYQNIQFKVQNTGTTNPFTDCRVQSWVGPASTDWVTLSPAWTACQALAAGGVTIWEIAGSSHEKLRVQAKSAAGTSAYCRPYGTGK